MDNSTYDCNGDLEFGEIDWGLPLSFSLTFFGFLFPTNLIGELGHTTMFFKVLDLSLVFIIRFELWIAYIVREYFIWTSKLCKWSLMDYLSLLIAMWWFSHEWCFRWLLLNQALAKELVRSRKTVNRLYENKAQLNSISMHLGESVGMGHCSSLISRFWFVWSSFWSFRIKWQAIHKL